MIWAGVPFVVSGPSCSSNKPNHCKFDIETSEQFVIRRTADSRLSSAHWAGTNERNQSAHEQPLDHVMLTSSLTQPNCTSASQPAQNPSPRSVPRTSVWMPSNPYLSTYAMESRLGYPSKGTPPTSMVRAFWKTRCGGTNRSAPPAKNVADPP